MMARKVTIAHALDPTADPAWTLTAEGYDPPRESSLASRFAISNGFLGVMGARATTLGGVGSCRHTPMWPDFSTRPMLSTPRLGLSLPLAG